MEGREYSINDLLALKRGEVVAFRREDEGHSYTEYMIVHEVKDGRLKGELLDMSCLGVNSLPLDDIVGNVVKIAKWDN